jgi:caffeoyl-CoA O-methyltransferase
MDGYAAAHSTPPSEQLRAVAQATRDWSDYPGMMVDAAEGRLLAMLVALTAARRILEVGTFTGYSAICMAEALPADGHITTLELSPEHAAKAAEHIELAGVAERISIVQGDALGSLAALRAPFDLAFIDADKPAYRAYFDAIVPLMRPGGLIVADNVLRGGRVLDPENPDPGVVGMRGFNDDAATDPRVEAVMLTVRDGITLIRVR